MCDSEKVGELFKSIEALAKQKFPEASAAYEVGLLRGVVRSLTLSKDPMKEIEANTVYFKQQLDVMLSLTKDKK